MTVSEIPSAPLSAAIAPLPRYESHSSLSTYASCPRRYAYRYVERLPGEVRPGQFAFGTAIHRAFETFVRARIAARSGGAVGPGLEALRSGFDAEIERSGLTPEGVERARERAIPAFTHFLDRESADDAEPVAVELGFGVPIELPGEAEQVRLVGYVDRVDRCPDGSTGILDYKSGRWRSQAHVDADRQLTAYAFACARGGLRDPADGATLRPASRVGLYFADSGALTWTTRNRNQLAAFEADVVETVQCIRRREFVARPAPAKCDWCDYRSVCPDALVESGTEASTGDPELRGQTASQ